MPKLYLIVCRDDTTPEGKPGDYIFATHKIFKDKAAAQEYMRPINSSREPLLITMDSTEILHFLGLNKL